METIVDATEFLTSVVDGEWSWFPASTLHNFVDVEKGT